jgi:hypothetical protein
MTKEEYENLLQSDYWKGYSYSLIKERNFTCEDCGRSFPNMRNMLQVHHLVYRDANPWSYKPEELIVLCKECHQKRHGIFLDSEPVAEKETTDEKEGAQSYTNTYTEEMSKRYANENSPKRKRNWFKLAVSAYVIMYLLYLVLKDDSKDQREQETIAPTEIIMPNNIVEEPKEEAPSVVVKKNSATKRQETKQKSPDVKKQQPLVEQKQSILIESTIPLGIEIPQDKNLEDKASEKENSSFDSLKETNRTNSEKKRTKRTGVKPRGTTSDIWEKVNRKSF